MVIFGPFIFIYQTLLQNMGKNSAKKLTKKQAKIANQKGNTNQTVVQGVSNGGFKLAPKQATSPVVVTDLSDIATLVAPAPPKFTLGGAKKAETKPEPPGTPPSAVVSTVLKPEEGYILETVRGKDGSISYTKVLVEKPTGWDVILCSRPAVEITPGTLIRFTPGEYNGKMTVLNPIIVSENTPLTKLFVWCVSQSRQVEELQLGELAKAFMTTNHVGKDENDKYQNFVAGLGILEVVGYLETGRLIIRK